MDADRRIATGREGIGDANSGAQRSGARGASSLEMQRYSGCGASQLVKRVLLSRGGEIDVFNKIL